MMKRYMIFVATTGLTVAAGIFGINYWRKNRRYGKARFPDPASMFGGY